ncbi:MAG: hypothetical protein RML35_12090 [Chloroherpetonaceae bacterium]|nr:hypothetical protein [Chloroherpetonaceae bacterium]
MNKTDDMVMKNEPSVQGKRRFKAHQGDVQIFEIDRIPEKAKKVSKRYFARSEKTGHVHALCGNYDLFEDEDGLYVKVYGEGAALNHVMEKGFEMWDKAVILNYADHKPVFLPAGTYKVGIQKRFNPFAAVWEKVTD